MSILTNNVRLTIDFSNGAFMRGTILDKQGTKIGRIQRRAGIRRSILIFINDNLLVRLELKIIDDFRFVEIINERETLIGKIIMNKRFQSVVSIENSDGVPICKARAITPHGIIRTVHPEDESQIFAVMTLDLIDVNRISARIEFIQSSNRELLLAVAFFLLLNKIIMRNGAPGET